MKSSAKFHLVCQIGLGKPLWARVFKGCCCNSDYCVRYCDPSLNPSSICLPDVATVITACGIVTQSIDNDRTIIGCNSDYCVRYCDTVDLVFVVASSELQQ